MTTQIFTKGNNQLNGIFCSLKNTITVNKASNQTWYGYPNDYFCATSAHNTYPIEPYPYQYIEIQLNGNYAKPTEYVLKGRSINNEILPVNWDFLGFDGTTWIVLKESRNDKLTQNTIRSYSLTTEIFFSAFRMKMQGKDSWQEWHLCIESIEIYGTLMSNLVLVVINHKHSSCSKARFHIFEFFVIILLLSS